MMKQLFNDLMESYNDALAVNGVSCSSRLGKLHRSKVITQRHEALGKECLDDTVIAEYVREISDRFNAGEIGQNHANAMRREIEQFIHFAKNSEIELPNPLLGARTVLSLEFQSIVDGFLSSDRARFGASGKPVALNTLNDMRWILF